MFYYLSSLRDVFFIYNILRYITFRAAAAAVTAFFLSMILGPLLINYLCRRKLCEKIERDHCQKLSGLKVEKKEIPTMGGFLIIGCVLFSVFLWADLNNFYIILTSFSCLWLFVLGFVDDYLKIRRPEKPGLSIRTKFFSQIVLGLLVGGILFLDPSATPQIEVPFLKDWVLHLGFFYIFFVAVVISGSSNAVNFTDGIDGLAIGCVLIMAAGLGILSYISGHMRFSEYLFLPFIPGSGELTIFCAAVVGASLGFLWFNCYPASIFMGDTGSLPLGGALGVVAILIKKEFLLILLGGIFVWEALSVILQIMSVKFQGKRIFKCAPFHHHLQLSGWEESKITIRLWIVAVILALLSLTTIKIR